MVHSDPKRATRASDADLTRRVVPRCQIFKKRPSSFFLFSSPPICLLSSPPLGPPPAARDDRRPRCSARRLPPAQPLSFPLISLLSSHQSSARRQGWPAASVIRSPPRSPYSHRSSLSKRTRTPWSPWARGPRRGEGGEDAHLPSPSSPLLPSQEQISPPIGPPPPGGVWRRLRRRATGRMLVAWC